MKLDHGAPGRIVFPRSSPRQRLHHRRDRAAPVQLQRRRRLPGLRRPRREAGVRRGPRRPQPRSSIKKGAVVPGPSPTRPRPITCRCCSLARAYDFDLETPWKDLAEEAKRRPPRHQGPPGHPPLRRRPQVLRSEEAVRRRHRQPQPPNASDRVRVDARGAVALPVVAAVRGLPRRPPQARSRWP